MRLPAIRLALLAACAIGAAPAHAANVLLTNDDGLTSNVLALYHALKDAGHDVIVSVPCMNQSGMGAALGISAPLAPLTSACLNDAAQPGDPGAGPMTRADLPHGDFYYVNSTPVMSLLHGLDVVAAVRWGRQPDLVLSGPNEGQNVGAIVLSSGTVSNAQFAAVRGLPAVALSAGGNTEDGGLANPLSATVARLTLQLIGVLEEKAGNGPLLAPGIALNVNFPDEPEGARWQMSQIGTYSAYVLGFTNNMAENASPTMRAMARQQGAELQPLPGITFDMNSAEPLPHQMADESLVYRQHIAVSPMQAGFGLAPASAAIVRWQLSDLIGQSGE